MNYLEKLKDIKARFLDLEEKLSDPEVITDIKRFSKINKEYKSLKELSDACDAFEELLGNIDTAKEMQKESDEEMKSMAKMELEELLPQKDEWEERLKVLLIPKDPEDSKDVIFEIRSGAGGDEASIFAGDLYKMYTKFFETKGFKVNVLDVNEGTVGGYNKIVLEIFGDQVFGTLKFESGAHRVQRVPKTESQGRVHTSAATVVVMPKYEEEDLEIKKDDLKTDTFRASGAGGQHVNKTESGVRFTHLPTGIAAESTDSRSQHKNREIAMERLRAKIIVVQKERANAEQKQQRKSLVGSGDRSDKIRTYNYPQNRVTDHRINLTLYSLDKIIQGQITDIVEALQVAENAEKMKSGDS